MDESKLSSEELDRLIDDDIDNMLTQRLQEIMAGIWDNAEYLLKNEQDWAVWHRDGF